MANAQRIIIASAVLALLVLVGVVSGSPTGVQQCRLVEANPLSGQDKPSPVLLQPSSKSTLFSFRGYLRYNTDAKEAYMPLTAESMFLVTFVGAERTRTEFHIGADCAQLTFNLTGPFDGGFFDRQVWLDSIEIQLAVANNGLSSCSAEQTGTWSWDYTAQYSHYKGSFGCVAEGADGLLNTVATLHIDQLKIELARDSKAANDGEFSKVEKQCYFSQAGSADDQL